MTPYYLNNQNLINRKSSQSQGQNVHRILEKQSLQRMLSQTTRSQPIYSQQNIDKKGKPPMSIIIGVIVVAIILMIALFIRVIFFPEDYINKGPTPRISMNWNEDHYNPGNYTGYVVSISGVSSINIDDVTVTVSQDGYSGSRDLDDIARGYRLVVRRFTLDFNDQRPTGRLGAEDQFTVTGGDTGDTIRLLYKPTGGQMCSSTFY
jgi:hypothetical protein